MAAMETFSGLALFSATCLLLAEAKQRGLTAFSQIGSGADLPLWGFFLISVIGILILVESAEAKIDAISEYRWLLLFYGYLYLFKKLLNESWRRYLPLFASLVLLLGVFSVFQFVLGWEVPKERKMVFPSGEFYRAVGFFNIPLTFAGIIGMSAFLLTGFAISYWQKSDANSIKLAGLCAVASLLGFAGVVVSLTRGAWLAAAITWVAGAGMVKRTWMLIALCIMVVVSVAGYVSNETIQQRANSIFKEDTVSNQHRKALWAANWAMIQDRPIFGYGGEQNIDRLPEYYEKIDVGNTTFIGHAHNNFLQVWAGQGGLALLCYLWFCGYFMWAAWSVARHPNADRFSRGVGLGSFSAQLYFHIAGMTECNFIDIKINHLLIFVWALTTACHLRLRLPHSIENRTKSGLGDI